MTFDYAPLAATASRLLGEFGKASLFIRVTPVTSTDSTAGTVTLGTPVNTSVNGAEVKHNQIYQPGATIEQGDRMFALAAAPNIEDQLVIDSELWEIVRVWPKKPGDTLVAAFAQVRN